MEPPYFSVLLGVLQHLSKLDSSWQKYSSIEIIFLNRSLASAISLNFANFGLNERIKVQGLKMSTCMRRKLGRRELARH